MKEYSFKLGIGYDEEFMGMWNINELVQASGDRLSEEIKKLPGVKWAGGDADEDPVIYELIVVGDISRNDIEAFLEYESNSSGSEGDLINYDFDEEVDYVNSGRPMDKLFSKGGKFWIQDAIKKPGALRKTAKKKGLLRNDKEKLSMTDLHKLEHMGGKTAKRAHLAETLKKMDGGGKMDKKVTEYANDVVEQFLPILARVPSSDRKKAEGYLELPKKWESPFVDVFWNLMIPDKGEKFYEKVQNKVNEILLEKKLIGKDAMELPGNYERIKEVPIESKKYPGQFTLGEDDGEKAMYTKRELELMKEGYAIELELNASRRGKAEMEAYQKEFQKIKESDDFFELTNTDDEFGGRWRIWKKSGKLMVGGKLEKISAEELEEIYLQSEKSGAELDWVLKQHGYTMADFESSVDKNKMPFAPGGKITTRVERKFNGQRDGKDIYYDANAAWTESHGTMNDSGMSSNESIAKVFRKGSGEAEVKYYKKNKDYKIIREERDQNDNIWLIEFLDTTSPTKATISFQLGDLYAKGGPLVIEDENDTEYKLEYISNLIRQGNTSGYNPYWKLNIKFDGELESSDTEQIAEYVEQGYHEGQIVSGEEGKTGWWNIEVEDTFAGGGKVEVWNGNDWVFIEVVGKRIKMIKMANDPNPIEPGAMGTIKMVDGIGQLHVNWDNGRTLAVIPDKDEYVVVDEMAGGGSVGEEETLWLIDGKPVKLKTGTNRSIKSFMTKNKLHTKYSGKAGLQIWSSNATEEEVVKYNTTSQGSATSQQYDLGGAIKFIEKAGNGYAVTSRLFGGWNLEQNRMPIGKYSDSQIIEFAENIGYVPTFADGGRLALLKKIQKENMVCQKILKLI